MNLSSSSSSSTSTPQNPNPLGDDPKSRSHKRKAGRKKFRETRHPVYRGVRQRNGNKWVCEIREPNKKSRIWVGTYPTPEMAARAHDVAVLALIGTSAKFNFPHSVSLLPLANSSSAIDIRAAAAKATTTTATTHSSSSSHCNDSSFGKNGNSEDPCLDISCMHGLEATEAMFFDEEAVYNMPGLLDSMAEGLLITPPSTKRAMDWDHVGSEMDLTLWTQTSPT